MSIYLAWSIYKLVGWLVIIAALVIWNYFSEDVRNYFGHNHNKFVFGHAVGGVLVVVLLAFNMGDRQQELGRSNFNASAPQTVDKNETNQQNADSVKQAFEQAVKK